MCSIIDPNTRTGLLTKISGLGVMGYNMAVNLRTKMPKEKTLVVCDVSEAAISRFQEQMKDSGPVVVAKSRSQAIQQAVSTLPY